MPELPQHLYKGRGAFAGPVIGGYIAFCYGPKSYAAADAPTTVDAPISFVAPCDFRLERISYGAAAFSASAATDTLLVNFYKGTTGIAAADLATLGTLLTSASNLTAKIATSTAAYWNYVEQGIATATTTSGGGVATFNATDSVRNVAKGQQVYVELTAGSTASTINNFIVNFTGYVTGHPNTSSIND